MGSGTYTFGGKFCSGKVRPASCRVLTDAVLWIAILRFILQLATLHRVSSLKARRLPEERSLELMLEVSVGVRGEVLWLRAKGGFECKKKRKGRNCGFREKGA